MTTRQANWLLVGWVAAFLSVVLAAWFTVRHPPKEMRKYPRYCYDPGDMSLSGVCSVSQSNVQLDI